MTIPTPMELAEAAESLVTLKAEDEIMLMDKRLSASTRRYFTALVKTFTTALWCIDTERARRHCEEWERSVYHH